jgi:transcriptional regulator with XRE-family HTH domain
MTASKAKGKCDSNHPFSEATALAHMLRAWRRQQQKKISAVASDLGVSTAAWAHWETGARFPGGKKLLQLSAYTGIPLPELICPGLGFALAGRKNGDSIGGRPILQQVEKFV